jgi:hypothetical protein
MKRLSLGWVITWDNHLTDNIAHMCRTGQKYTAKVYATEGAAKAVLTIKKWHGHATIHEAFIEVPE